MVKENLRTLVGEEEAVGCHIRLLRMLVRLGLAFVQSQTPGRWGLLRSQTPIPHSFTSPLPLFPSRFVGVVKCNSKVPGWMCAKLTRRSLRQSKPTPSQSRQRRKFQREIELRLHVRCFSLLFSPSLFYAHKHPYAHAHILIYIIYADIDGILWVEREGRCL